MLDHGITFIDTSIDYGKSEDLIGRYISHRRDEYFLASKCGCSVEVDPASPPPYPHDFSRSNVRAGVEQSLTRLKTDHLDLVQVHHSPAREELERESTVDELLALREEGKVRFLGMSGTLPNLPEQIEMAVFDAFQIPYSGLQREHEALISRAAQLGAGTIIRGGVARGAPIAQTTTASGAASPNTGENKRRWQQAEIEDLLDGMSSMEFMLRFTLTHPQLHTTIVGTANLEHLASNVAAAEKGPLPSSTYQEALTRFELAGSVPS